MRGDRADEVGGYIERVPDPSDRRAKLIRPTKRGLAFMATTKDALADIEKRWIKALGKDTLTQLRDTLAEIRALERWAPDAQMGCGPRFAGVPRADRGAPSRLPCTPTREEQTWQTAD